MIQGRPCGTPGAKWQAVGRSMHRACGEGKDGGNKTIVLPVLAFWVQVSTAYRGLALADSHSKGQVSLHPYEVSWKMGSTITQQM